MEQSSRTAIDAFDTEFRQLHDQVKALVTKAGDELLFREVVNSHKSMMPHSVGTFAIRSVATVEQMINGITVRLWDDPFEWTLPEQLPAVQDIIGYFDGVEASRIRGFSFLNCDDDLQKETPAPVQLKTLGNILRDTLERSRYFLSEAQTLLSKIE